MTIIEKAQKGIITEQMRLVAEEENLSPEFIRKGVASGTIAIIKNNKREIKPLAVGEGLRTKVNANIGTSEDIADVKLELEKLKAAVDAKADAVMDLSTGGDLRSIREQIIKNSPVAVGTVPIYEVSVNKFRSGEGMIRMTPDEIFDTIEAQAEQGVDFMTVHCGVTRSTVERLEKSGRIVDVVSRGGAFLIMWMYYNKRENPLYEYFDRLLEIAHRYDVTLSLGDGLRPGGLPDATDRPQVQEMIFLGELVKKAREKGVQAIIEGPGHIPINEIEMNVKLEKKLCHNAPFYVLGPLVTDIAAGYDHITAAIGGAIAAAAGADFLCYVTRTEHLSLPDVDAVREGVIAARIAAHAGDIAKGVKGAYEQDLEMSKARHALDWEKMLSLAIDPKRASKLRSAAPPTDEDVCTMCGEYCALKRLGEIRRLKS
ncbi:phosphomethylpyrimidine synthase ThiC [bacterium]|nr:phosphomethylpyrimidine synthase ThiC [bacterium]